MLPVLFFFGFFLLSLLLVFLGGKFNRKHGIVGTDINKPGKPVLPEAVGIALLLPLWVSLAAIMLLFFNSFSLPFFVFGLVVSCFALIGFVDDTKHKFLAKAMPWPARAAPIALISLLFAALHFQDPVWVVLGALFIAGLASFENTFAGLNGWEVGSGFIVSCFVTLAVSTAGSPPLFLLALALNGMVLGLLFWNRYPARVFPGDSGTLLVGSALAGILIMNGRIDMMVLGLLFFLPHFIDFFGLKILTNARDVSQSKSLPYAVLPDGRLAVPNAASGAKLDFAKLVLKAIGPKKEWQVVLVIWLVVALNCLLWSALFGII